MRLTVNKLTFNNNRKQMNYRANESIVKASFASALAAPSVRTPAIEASFIALGLASVQSLQIAKVLL